MATHQGGVIMELHYILFLNHQRSLNAPNLHIELLTETKDFPFDLLELADPSRAQIESYLRTGFCYVAKFNSEIVGVLVLNKKDTSTVEIKNIAVKPSEQGKGIGTALLNYSGRVSLESGFKKLIIGTGNSSIAQLELYQKAGFDIIRIERDFFLRNYSEPIFENGIQCRHMIILEKDLSD